MVDVASGEAPAGEQFASGGWASLQGRRAPVDITQVPDAALGSCRLLREWLALGGALALLAALLSLLLVFDFHPAQLGIAGFATAWLADTALKLLVLPRQVGGAVEITASQFD